MAYSPHFTVFWDNIGSTRAKGSKAEAQEQWEKQGRPPADALIAKWNEYLVSCGELSPKDVCRWLKFGMHMQEYNAPIRPLITRAAGKTSNNVAVAEEYMRKRGIV